MISNRKCNYVLLSVPQGARAQFRDVKFNYITRSKGIIWGMGMRRREMKEETDSADGQTNKQP